MSSNSAQTAERVGHWQENLQNFCATHQLGQPTYQTASDRRGTRTAWSATVCVGGCFVPARYWYSGEYIHNAREDAAHVAYQWLISLPNYQQCHRSHPGPARPPQTYPNAGPREPGT
ncbi:hypothetical protein EJ06DRAFT_259461 [Trichodelitschia bisporula]|uniref:DRBM domain-containing protein n=1 Tax=Trichodelitschia bisporula TaxID=703511 RepID=A0A6G1HIM9_9PEZI|nr:hypothetical protein EJ06DRAFT_259461 [Trichodelitschia bisporula]